MKLLVRWGLTLGLAGSVMFGNILGINNLQALALPQEQVVKTLQEVPVFTLTNPKGEFVVISKKNQSKTISQIGFFISKKDAQTFLENRLKKENSQLASTIQITPVSLADYYKLVVENNKKKDSNLVFALVPAQQQVNLATTMLNNTGKPDKKFEGIPLFVPKFKKENSYLTIPQGQERLIPFYFEKEQAVALLEAFKKAKPKEAANTEIQVLDLYNVIETLNSSNDPNSNKILLYPSRESIEFLRSLVPNQPKK
ncbi:MAG: Tic22 family protein [Nostocales cyanobacterium ELA583]|jgi:nickel transport protein